jgi:hypothetical protein
MCIAVGQRWEIDPNKILLMLFDRINAAITDNRRGAAYTASLLGADFAEGLKMAKLEHLGAITTGSTIDLTKLHRSTKTKSGFTGVYANGSGFRSAARQSDGSVVHLGTYDTAEEASWVRYLYYQKHDLPYGTWEEAIEERRARGMSGSDADLIFDYEDGNVLVGKEHLNQLPGRPKNPSTVPVTSIGEDRRSVADELEAMKRANDERLAALQKDES